MLPRNHGVESLAGGGDGCGKCEGDDESAKTWDELLFSSALRNVDDDRTAEDCVSGLKFLLKIALGCRNKG